jgi:hypothetical protein
MNNGLLRLIKYIPAKEVMESKTSTVSDSGITRTADLYKLNWRHTTIYLKVALSFRGTAI